MKNGWKRCAAILAAAAFAAAATAVADAPKQTEGITVPVYDNMKQHDVPENEAMAFMRKISCGWNLGNTFDAYDRYDRFIGGTRAETIWCGAKTTRELLQEVRNAGFLAIRIPVSWHNHVDEAFTIDPAWMERVQEVVGWALELDFYVIVNVHHDNDPAWFYPDSAHYERSAAYLTAIWTQMAEAFGGCGDHLILESMNEPRLTGTPYEWSWDEKVPACRDAADCINRLNQLFVDTIRASGGNNAERYLAVPAYDAGPWYACTDAFVLPEDPANRIIVSAHAYSPYNFALNRESSDCSFDPQRDIQKVREIYGIMEDLYGRFVSRGIPVMMDEFGALEKSGNTQARVNYTAYYTAAAASFGIPCFVWDNHFFSGNQERFGLIERNRLEWVYPDVALAIVGNRLGR